MEDEKNEQAAPSFSNFQKILPKKKTQLPELINSLSNPQISEIVDQMEVLVQLLMQNFLFISNRNRQIEILNLINKIYLEKENQIFLNGVKKHEVYLVDFKFGNKSLKTLRNFIANRFEAGTNFDSSTIVASPAGISVENLFTFVFAPQISVFQCPSLETQKLIEKAVKKNLPKEQKLSMLKELVPLFRNSYIPIFKEETKVGSNKFVKVDDALLFNGLIKYTCKNLSRIQENCLPHKTLEEVRNRFKNLTRRKAARNVIKNWKIRELAPLTQVELQNFEKGRLWFGPHNYRLISKYFLPNRSEEFLSRQSTLNGKMLIKRSQSPLDLTSEAVDGVILDCQSDFYTESPEEAAENEAFIVFLRELLSNNRSIMEILSKPLGEGQNVSFNLSDQKLSFSKFSRNSKSFLDIKRNSIRNSRIERFEGKILQKTQVISRPGIRHSLLSDGSVKVRRPRLPQIEGDTVLRLAPTFKELQQAAERVSQKMNLSVHNNELFHRFVF